MWHRIFSIFRKELIVTFRDPRLRLMLFGPPLVQLIVFGFAVNLDVENTRLAWIDPDRSSMSRLLAQEFEGSHFFEITHPVESLEEAQELLEHGQVNAIVHIPQNFESVILSGQTAPLQVVLDGSDSNSASVVSGYLSDVLRMFQEELVLEESGIKADIPVQLESRVWFNPQLESRMYFIPGVIVNIVGLITTMLTAMAIVREKEIGTLEQLMVTPIRPLELMLGKTLPFALVGFVEMCLVTGAALLVFQVPFRGSPLVLLAGSLFFVVSSLGMGLFISTLSNTQQQAMMGTFFFFLPAFLLSGFAFPIRNMPWVIQWLTLANPLRYFMEIVRGVFLKGLGFAPLSSQFLGLAVLGVLVLSASSLRFQKRVE